MIKNPKHKAVKGSVYFMKNNDSRNINKLIWDQFQDLRTWTFIEYWQIQFGQWLLSVQVLKYTSRGYPCKKIHSYTDMTNTTLPSITYARGGRRGLSLEKIYVDDQVVIFGVENFLLFQFNYST